MGHPHILQSVFGIKQRRLHEQDGTIHVLTQPSFVLNAGYLAANSDLAPSLRASALSVASQVKDSPLRPKWP